MARPAGRKDTENRVPPPSDEELRAWQRSALIWRRLAFTCLVLATLLGWFALWLRPVAAPVSASVAPATPREAQAPRPITRIGPWGELEITPVSLERPDHLFTKLDEYFELRPWIFANSSTEELHELFSHDDLTVDQKLWLNEETYWTTDGYSLALLPPHEFVLSLSLAARTRIYNRLAKSPGNLFKSDPFWITDDWADGSGLSPETIARIETLIYPCGDARCFSDVAAVGATLTPAEQARLLRTLSRQRALQVRLVVRPDTDLESIASYWGAPARSFNSGSMLQALRQKPEGGRLDISYLLPIFAREHLFTFPDPATDDLAHVKDCFWTAMNFDTSPPNPRFLEPDYRVEYLQQNYSLVEDAPQLGDVFVLVNEEDIGIHACVYIAADIIFTKNGAAPSSPWVLMEAEELFQLYTAIGQFRLLRYRANPEKLSRL